MNKELTPLEALEKIGKLETTIGLRVVSTKTIVKDFAEYNIIETALKNCETYKNMLKEEYDKNIKLKEIAIRWKECSQKQVEILRIIKEKRVNFTALYSSKRLETYNWCMTPKEQLNQAEFDLLREVLL